MKKLITFLMAALLTLCIPFSTVYAFDFDASSMTQQTTFTEDLADGFYAEYTLTTSGDDLSASCLGIASAVATASTSKTVTSSLTCKVYNSSSDVIASYVLTGTFTYDGSTSKCTNATYSTTTYASGWSFSSASATYSGNTAAGSFTAVHKVLFVTVQTVNKILTISCDKDGVITTSIA